MLSLAVPALAVGGLLAALVPLAIHLLWRRRRRPVEWAAMELLRQAVRRRRRRLQVERWILLAARMLVLVLLGLAVSRPLLSSGAIVGGGGRTLWIVLDEGLVSAAPGEVGTALDDARAWAESLVASLAPGDAAGLVLASSPPRIVLEPTSDHAVVLDRLRRAAASLAPSDLLGAIALAEERLAARGAVEGEVAVVAVASSLREGALPEVAPTGGAEEGGEDAVVLLAMPPATREVSSISVASVEPGRAVAGGPTPIRVRLVREGDLSPRRTRVAATAGTTVDRTVSWSAGEREVELELMLELPEVAPDAPGRVGVEVSVDPDEHPVDDRRTATADARSRARVGIADRSRLGVGSGAGWISRALSPSADAGIEVVELEPGLLEERSLRDLDAVVLPRPDRITAEGWAALAAMRARGGVVLVVPPAPLDSHAWLERLPLLGISTEVAREVVDADEGAAPTIDPRSASPAWFGMVAGEMEDLASPVEVRRRLATASGASGESILSLSDGSPLLLAASDEPSGGSTVLLLSAPDLAWTDLPVRPLMVPLVHEVLREGLARAERARRLEVGEVGRHPGASRVIAPSGAAIDVDEQGIAERATSEPGLHRLLDGAGREMGIVAAGIDARAARASPSPADAARRSLGRDVEFVDASGAVSRLATEEGGRPLWTALAAAALLLAVVETLLARRFSHASRAEAAASEEAPAFLASFGGSRGARA